MTSSTNMATKRVTMSFRLFAAAVFSNVLLSLTFVNAVDFDRLGFATKGGYASLPSDDDVLLQGGDIDYVVEVRHGQDVVLECEAISRAGPTIHWLYQGQPIQQGNKKMGYMDEWSTYESKAADKLEHTMSATKSRLYIHCATPRDAGDYTCVADTPTKRISSTHTLVVDPIGSKRHLGSILTRRRRSKQGMHNDVHGSSCAKRNVRNHDGARIYMWTTRRLEIEGRNIQLLCRASGKPTPKTVWMDRDEKVITPAHRQYELLENGDLLIKDASWEENMGLYRCVADNGVGVDEVSVFLYPAGKEPSDSANRILHKPAHKS